MGPFNDSSLIVVPEHAVKSAAMFVGTTDSSFAKVLDKVSIYRKAEMTPIILMDPVDLNVYVVALETYNKKLH
jgi:hypothetical protein